MRGPMVPDRPPGAQRGRRICSSEIVRESASTPYGWCPSPEPRDGKSTKRGGGGETSRVVPHVFFQKTLHELQLVVPQFVLLPIDPDNMLAMRSFT
ncbi:hypothetical protein EYF80_024220 [Liparis tanakae]|uniref:Uncharacterized protein n=1 Tax=Liparis tanakae TaxID=230148 RepID=A0A4Z2HL26_9TELE|nr:hypothetical protein EYF80_024220 [Liparis tanakae]